MPVSPKLASRLKRARKSDAISSLSSDKFIAGSDDHHTVFSFHETPQTIDDLDGLRKEFSTMHTTVKINFFLEMSLFRSLIRFYNPAIGTLLQYHRLFRWQE
jgi:hypothetical protein